MTRTVRSALAAAGVVALMASPAVAQQTCRDMVDRFAAAQNLSSSSPPVVVPPAVAEARPGTAGTTTDGGATSGPSMSDKLSQSGGVLKPPAIGDQAVIDPPRQGTGNMPTAPRVAPGTGSGSTTESPTGASPDRAAQRAQMESLVTAARAAAERGDDRGCMESLSKAQALTERGRGAGGGG